jgi:hypothetical protein
VAGLNPEKEKQKESVRKDEKKEGRLARLKQFLNTPSSAHGVASCLYSAYRISFCLKHN